MVRPGDVTILGRQVEVVKMRVVWGLDIQEISEALGLSRSTVKRDWRFAKAWLLDETSRRSTVLLASIAGTVAAPLARPARDLHGDRQ